MAKVYEWIGRRSTDMPTTQNYNSERGRDVTGKPFSLDTKDVETMTVDLIINGKSELAMKLDEIIERGLELSDLDITLVVARRYKRIGTSYETGKPSAYRQMAKFVPGDWATGNAELRGTAEIAFVGIREHGTFDPGSVSGTWDWLYPDGQFDPETTKPPRSQVHFKDGDASREEYGIFFEYDDMTI